MKNVIIHTTNDEVVSLRLVDKILSDKDFKNYKISDALIKVYRLIW